MSVQDARAYDRAVGGLLRALRHRYRIKQEQLAVSLGVDVATVSRYERGERAMSVGTLLMIADQFQVPASALLPQAHQQVDSATVAQAPTLPSGIGSLLAQIPQLEAGAITSIIQVLAVRPDLIVPVMALIEQHADGAPEG
jgi:transcriptional regulator with XRE-family HTH domain